MISRFEGPLRFLHAGHSVSPGALSDTGKRADFSPSAPNADEAQIIAPTVTVFMKSEARTRARLSPPHKRLPRGTRRTMVRAFVRSLKLEHFAWFLALICGVAPLWVTHSLPLVDLPQHLHLISVLHRLDDTSTLYPEVFARRPVLTPYLGYYYAVSALNWLMPLELANTVFLSLYVAGLPLSLAFLLLSLKRPTWPALLAIPFAYGDSFGWGFVNFCSALPLAFLTCGLFVRAIEDELRRRAWALGLSVSLVAVLLFHVQVFAYLALALPVLLVLTPAPEGPRSWRGRLPALLGVVPAVVLFFAWVGLRVGQPTEIAPDQPWKSRGPMLSPQNLSWKSFDINRDEFLPMLGNLVPDGSDQLAVRLALGLALVAIVAGVFMRNPKRAWGAGLLAAFMVIAVLGGRHFSPGFGLALLGLFVALSTVSNAQGTEGPVAQYRLPGLAALGVLLYFALPFDVHGYMYYLNTRYAHLAAALLVICVPVCSATWAKRLVWVGVALAVITALPLGKAFRAFGEDEKSLEQLATAATPKARVMGLVFNTMSAASTHPVFLHASTVIARLRGGLTNFSFALTPHSPLMYRAEAPPTFASEWHPEQMNWQTQGRFYDHFVVRGVHPRQLFGALLQQGEVKIVAQGGDWFLVRRVTTSGNEAQ